MDIGILTWKDTHKILFSFKRSKKKRLNCASSGIPPSEESYVGGRVFGQNKLGPRNVTHHEGSLLGACT